MSNNHFARVNKDERKFETRQIFVFFLKLLYIGQLLDTNCVLHIISPALRKKWSQKRVQLWRVETFFALIIMCQNSPTSKAELRTMKRLGLFHLKS